MTKRVVVPAALGTCLVAAILCVPLCKSWANGSLFGREGRTSPVADAEGVGSPKAVAEQERYDFGVVQVAEQREWTFMVRNDGKTPLELKSAGASCGCIQADIADSTVPPGKRTGVVVAWKPYKPAPVFIQHVKVRTNDPKKPILYFEVAGRVSNRLGISPPGIIISAARPWEQPQAGTTIYSQEWDQFEVTRVEAVPETMKCEVLPATAEQLENLQAKSGYELKVTLPPGLPKGPFEALLRVHTRNPADKATADAAPLEIQVQGSVVGYYSIFGPGGVGFDSTTGALMVEDAIAQGDRIRLKCVLIAYGEHRTLEIRKIETKPEFLHVTVTPEGNASKPGRYSLDVEIPPDAPTCNYGPTKPAEVLIVTDHPQAPEIRFKVQFIVRPRDRFRD